MKNVDCAAKTYIVSMFSLHSSKMTYTCTGYDVAARRLRNGEYTGAVRVHSIPVLLCVVAVIISNPSQGRKLFKMSQNITAVAKPLISI